jgi:hypothetical protein
MGHRHFAYTITYHNGTVRLTADSDGSAADGGMTKMQIGASGVAGSAGYVGGLRAEFADTQGGTMTCTYNVDPTNQMRLDMPGLPGDFQIAGGDDGQWWDLGFDGTFNGPITLTFCYDDSLLDPDSRENLLTLFHDDGADWEELRVLGRDLVANTITVETWSLSPFVLGLADEPPVVPEPAGVGVVGVMIIAWKLRRRT